MSTGRGLTTLEAERRLGELGPNLVPQARRTPVWRQLLAQLTHLLALLLWVAAGLALVGGMPELAVAIVVVVLLNAVFAFWQEFRADRSAERLRSLLPSRVRVRRDGVVQVLDAAALVPEDVVVLEAGDRIAADLRVLTGSGLSVDESMVTGESVPVRHDVGEDLAAGTFVVQGSAEAEVVATGAATTLAGISTLAASAHRPPSPLARELHGVVRVVAVIATVTGVALGVGALLLGLEPTEAFLFGVGVTVALVPEGLLPTVTLSLARGAQLMADEQALVRRLDAVETLGATTFVCTDKTGTLTQNRMTVVEVWTPAGTTTPVGSGYDPNGRLLGTPEAAAATMALAAAAVRCVSGRVLRREQRWVAQGDPMEAALHCLALRSGWVDDDRAPQRLFAYSADRMLTTAVLDGEAVVLGAPESVIARCVQEPAEPLAALEALTGQGFRVLAVARRDVPTGVGDLDQEQVETGLTLLGLVGIEDPPREGIAEALQACRDAQIRVAMLTGDHPRTAAAIARQVGLVRDGGTVLDGPSLPTDLAELGALVDQPDGVVVARVSPGDKLRIARALKARGHVVTMTGDGVNDAPALREADVGVAMGASGSDVARSAADLVLLDDHFATIVSAVRLGRATFANVRRFLTYHLTDNVAELAPFAVWALSGGEFPLAIGVLQVLALDIGTDLLPALALGAEPPSRRVMQGPLRAGRLVDRRLLTRALGVLGPAEAVASLSAFTLVLLAGGWSWGTTPDAATLAVASGTAFACICLAQLANAFACRSETHPVWALRLGANRLLLGALVAELALLAAFVGIPALADLLGGSWPSPTGWAMAVGAAGVLVLVDAAHKGVRHAARAPVPAAVEYPHGSGSGSA